MGNLKDATAGSGVPLCHQTLVGRSRDADLRILDRRISAQHAIISYNQGMWEAKDLGSRNGTVVDGRRLPPGARIPLNVGSSVRFGASDVHWVLASDDAPDVVAVSLETDEVMEGEHGLIRFTPGLLLLTEDGANYWFESAGKRTKVVDRQVLEVAGRRWRVTIPIGAGEGGPTLTAEGVLLSRDVTLQFRVSPDQEHVQVKVLADGIERELRSRSFDHLLLALARARIADETSRGLPEEEQGWVFTDELADQLDMDPSHVNVDVYRARKRFAEAGIQGADEMLQRRLQTRALRLGCRRVEVT